MTGDEIRKLAEAIGNEVYVANMQTIFSLLCIASMVMFVAIVVFEILQLRFGGRK